MVTVLGGSPAAPPLTSISAARTIAAGALRRAPSAVRCYPPRPGPRCRRAFLLNFVASAAVAHDDLVYPAFRVGLALPSAEPQAEPLRPPRPDIISMHEQQTLNKPFQSSDERNSPQRCCSAARVEHRYSCPVPRAP